MAGGGVVHAAGGKAAQYEGHVTVYVVLASIVAASGGLLFGYDIGISGGVTAMEEFLKKFFPGVQKRMQSGSLHESHYCKYDDQGLQLFTSSLYLASLVASLFAASVTRRGGRKASMLAAGVAFLVGAILNAAAQNLAMLIIGRILLGVGVGFANQSVPLYLSEMAPPKLRGRLNIMFQLATTIGILVANIVNFGTAKMKENGWRVSLGLAAVPAVILICGGLFCPETPNSLIERGKIDEGRRVLARIRGTDNVGAEYDDVVEASEVAQRVKHPLRSILQKRNRPQLVMAVAIPVFQQFTGINAIMFYVPVLMSTFGFGQDTALISAVGVGFVNMVATVVALFVVDKYGRRVLFLEGGVQMLISQLMIAIILAFKFSGNSVLTASWASGIVVLVCIYVAAFAWSWGPLGWLVPSEIFPLETRSAGQSINVAVNMTFTFVIAQAFLSILCSFQYGIFLFFAGFVVLMTAFVALLLPETKGVPIEEMIYTWRAHWFWKRILPTNSDLPTNNTPVNTN